MKLHVNAGWLPAHLFTAAENIDLTAMGVHAAGGRLLPAPLAAEHHSSHKRHLLV